MTERLDSFGIYELAVVGFPATFGPSRASLLTRWNAIGNGNGQSSVIANKGNRGNPALYLPFGGDLSLTVSHQTKYTFGCRLNMGCVAGVGGAADLVSFANTVGSLTIGIATLQVQADGSILVYGNTGPGPRALLLTTAIVVAKDTDCVLEFSATVSGTTNMNIDVEVRINGVSVGTASGLIGRNANTLVSGVANFNRLILSSGVATTGQAYFSDMYLNNGAGATNTGFQAGTLSPYLQVGYLLPRADGLTLDWTPDAGSVHYTEILTIPENNGSTYVSSGTPGNVDSYLWQPIPGFTGTVCTVQLSFCASSDQEGTRTMQGNIGPAGAQQQMAPFGLCSSYFYRCQAFDLDPTTGLAWTQAAFNARAFGIGMVS